MLVIVCPDLQYNEALTCMDLGLLNEHHCNLCNDLFSDILNDKNHSLWFLIPALHKAAQYTLSHTTDKPLFSQKWKLIELGTPL